MDMPGRGKIQEKLKQIQSIKNKRPMCHTAHLRNKFKSVNTNDYIIKLIRRKTPRHYLIFEN